MLRRIPWRDAVKRFHVLVCLACNRSPELAEWWLIDNDGPYCATCVIKLKETDSTHSVTQFFKTTRG